MIRGPCAHVAIQQEAAGAHREDNRRKHRQLAEDCVRRAHVRPYFMGKPGSAHFNYFLY